MVICLERSADLHMAQLMPLPLTGKRAVKRVCVYYYMDHNKWRNLIKDIVVVTNHISEEGNWFGCVRVWLCPSDHPPASTLTFEMPDL